MMFVPYGKHASTACYGDSFTIFVDDVRTSQETRFHGLLRRQIYILYADDVRTSRETPFHGLLYW
jgi:hypothetical protein